MVGAWPAGPRCSPVLLHWGETRWWKRRCHRHRHRHRSGWHPTAQLDWPCFHRIHCCHIAVPETMIFPPPFPLVCLRNSCLPITPQFQHQTSEKLLYTCLSFKLSPQGSPLLTLCLSTSPPCPELLGGEWVLLIVVSSPPQQRGWLPLWKTAIG